MNTNQGCLTLIGLILAIPILTAFWPAILVLSAVGVIAYLIKAYNQQATAVGAQQWNQKYSNSICSYGDHHGSIIGLTTTSQGIAATISFLEQDGNLISLVNRDISLRVSPRAGFLSLEDLEKCVHDSGIELTNELSVEFSAMQTALSCIEERCWSAKALEDLHQMCSDINKTLAIAEGNELLEPAIPQLRSAKDRFEEQIMLIQNAVETSRQILQDLSEFLSIPAAIRPVLSFEQAKVNQTRQLMDLKTSYENVISLNDIYRDLSSGSAT